MARKKGNGEGSISKYADGRWCGRLTVTTPDGKRKRVAVYGKTKGEARVKLTKAMAEADEGLVFDAKNLTVREYLQRWLNDSVKSSVRRRTFESYAYVVRKHLIPGLGAAKLKALSPAQVQALYQHKLDSGLSRRTVQLVHTTLHKALKQAVRWGLVPRNVTEVVSAPRPEKKDIRPLDPEQAKDLLRTAHGARFEALYVLAVTAGLRRGEILGLKWDDLDLERRVVRVRRQIARNGGVFEFTTPKRGKGRSVDLVSVAVEALVRHREGQMLEKRRLGNLWQDTGLVFTTEVGTPLDADNLIKRSFKPLLERAGLPQIRFHDLRHTCATLFLARGTNPKIVQEILGHANISQTMDTYSHVLPSIQSEAVAAMEGAFS